MGHVQISTKFRNMWLAQISFLFATSTIFLGVSGEMSMVPPARLEAFKNGGFHVSIPNVDGMRLFAFHGNLNKPLKDLEAGQFSKDVMVPDKQTGRWTFVDMDTQLKKGDVINYWTYIIKDNLGYSRKDERFVVYEYADETQNNTINTEETPEYNYVKFCNGNSLTTSNSPEIPRPPIVSPMSTKENALASCIKVVRETTACLNSVQDQLKHLESEYEKFKQQELQTTPTPPIQDPNVFRFAVVVGGNLPHVPKNNTADLLHLVNFILWEKLELPDLEARTAIRNKDGASILFDMFDAMEKQQVLAAAKRKIVNSTIFVRDVIHV